MFLSTCNLYYLFRVTDNVSWPHQTNGKLLYVSSASVS